MRAKSKEIGDRDDHKDTCYVRRVKPGNTLKEECRIVLKFVSGPPMESVRNNETGDYKKHLYAKPTVGSG